MKLPFFNWTLDDLNYVRSTIEKAISIISNAYPINRKCFTLIYTLGAFKKPLQNPKEKKTIRQLKQK